MPRIELTEDQKAEAAVLAEKVARIMDEKPEIPLSELWDDGTITRNGYWKWDCDSVEWIPTFSLDGTALSADAVACARMKERLIEWGMETGSVSEEVFLQTSFDPWHHVTNPWAAENSYEIRLAQTESIAVAKLLIDTAEQRQKEGK